MPLLAMALLVVNDHWLKDAFGNVATGKLSDFAGMAFFPLLLQACVEVALRLAGRPWGPSRRVLVACAVATALVFLAVNTSELANTAWSHALGILQWPVNGALVPVQSVSDPTDLVALSATPLAIRVGWRRAR